MTQCREVDTGYPQIPQIPQIHSLRKPSETKCECVSYLRNLCNLRI